MLCTTHLSLHELLLVGEEPALNPAERASPQLSLAVLVPDGPKEVVDTSTDAVKLDAKRLSFCAVVARKRELFLSCMRGFLAEALFESEDLAGHSYMTVGFFDSCMCTYIDVLEEFVTFDKPTVIQQVIEFDPG